MSNVIPASVRSFLAEPAVPDPPRRNRRDWVLVTVASIVAVLEATLRTDADWVDLPLGWQIASVVQFFVGIPAALLWRRTRPLAATAWGFASTMSLSIVMALTVGVFGGLIATSVMLVVPYALFRWGSGRDAMWGAVILVLAGVFGNLTDPGSGLGDWIGGFIVLGIPVEAGLAVRYRSNARARMIDDAKSREREQLARELHDTVAHHVSAIAVQAQAGQALATTAPERAVEILAVIEATASTTLDEMRAMVGSLRAGSNAELTPQQGVADLPRLADGVVGGLSVDVDVDSNLGRIGPAVDAALFRIAQESITNAVRHARRARRVDVRVESLGDSVRLTVTDDGERSEPRSGQGYGLLGMAERTHLLGGIFEAGPASPRGGWRVSAELPRSAVAP
jgi:signal transduction histidine kinase